MQNDLDNLQGTWNVTALETDGQDVEKTAFDGSKIVIKGRTFTSTGMGTTYKGTIEIDSTRSPKTIDLLFSAGPEKGHRNLGIYELDGDGWTICLSTRGTSRPRTFATRSGTGLALETLERDGVTGKTKSNKTKVNKTKVNKTTAKTADRAVDRKPDSDPAGSGAPTELEGEWPMVSAVFDGAAMDKNMVQWCKRVTRGNLTTVMAGPQVMLKATFTVDASPTPQAIDYVNLAGPHKGKPQRGIYELSGETLKICMAAPGKARPTEFSSQPGDGRSFTSWRLGCR